MQFPLPAASPALFGQRMLLRATLVTDSKPDLDVIDLTTERETTADERAYAVRLQGFIAASTATLQGASA
jgi:hypothetical protein